MSIDFLFADFDRLIQSAESVHRLRRFILDLAVRGKLVPQDPNDEPASELMKRIASEKARLVKAGEIKKQKRVARFEEAEPTFELPSGWFPTKLALVAVCLDYMRKPVNGTERKRRIAGKSRSQLFPYFGATQQQGWIDEYIFDEELVLLGEDGVPFFDSLRPKAYLISGKSWVNNHAHVFRGILVSNAYLVHYLNVFDYSGRVVGATRSKLNQANAVDIPVMLPPVAEQHRIVAKVDELMALCDRLEAARTEREATRDRLATESLARLNVPDPDPAMFQHDVAFALNNLTPLTTRPDQIKALRQTILNLAVRGKLLPQDPNDEPASELLKQIASEKARLVKARGIRKTKVLPPVDATNAPFVLPEGWTWARFPEIGIFGRGKSKHRPRNDSVLYEDGKYPFIQTGDVARSGGTIKTYTDRYNDVGLAQSALWPAGTLCITIAANIADSGILTFAACFPDSIVGLIAHDSFEDARFFEYFLRTVKGDLHEFAPSTAQKNINLGILEDILIPLPPLAEQRRIVSKVDELMVLCNRLEARLYGVDKTRGELVEAFCARAARYSDDRGNVHASNCFRQALSIRTGPAQRTSRGALHEPLSVHEDSDRKRRG